MKKQLSYVAFGFAIAALVLGLAYRPEASAAVPGANYLADRNTSGAVSSGDATFRSPYLISGDGKYVAFSTSATDLVAGTTQTGHIYIRDTSANTTVLVDQSAAGVEANNYADVVAISNDGRYVLFNSWATNLIDGTTLGSGVNRVYVRDTIANTTKNITAGEAAGISSDGKYVMLTGISIPGGTTYTKNQTLVKNLQTGQWQNASTDTTGTPGNKDSIGKGMSCSGNVVAFTSGATNLPGNSAVYGSNVNLFVGVLGWSGIENLTNITNVTSGTSIGNAQVSCDGNVVVYTTGTAYPATPHSYKFNRLTGVTTEVGKSSTGASVSTYNASISGDGRYVAFMSKQNSVDSAYSNTNTLGYYDVYIRDTKNNTTQLVTFNSAGSRLGYGKESVAISADGSKIAYSYTTPSSHFPLNELIFGVYNPLGLNNIYASDTGF